MLLWPALLACTAPPETGPGAPRLDADALETATRALTDLGPRMVTHPAELDARDHVAAVLEAAGLEVTLEPFTWDAWLPGEAHLTVGGTTWAAEALSPSPTASLTAPLVEGGDVEGALALVSDEDGSRTVQMLSLQGSGAAAMVRVTEAVGGDGSPLVEVGHTLQGSRFVSVAVDAAAGAALRAALGAEATLEVATGIREGHTSHNVRGRLEGTGSGTVFVTAHYDSWFNSECATDNALGVATLLLLARDLAAGPPPPLDVVFLVTSAEEQGLRGAFAWVEANPDLVSEGRGVLNLDIPWASEGTYAVSSTRDDWIAAGLAEAAAQGLEAEDGGAPSSDSDHLPFQMRGQQAFWAGRWGDRHYHTTGDTVERLDFEQAAAALQVNRAVLARMLGR